MEIVFAEKEKYVKYFEVLKKYLSPRYLKLMTIIKQENMFIDNATRKRLGGSGYFEFKYCKQSGEISVLAKDEPYECWLEDSLYFYMDYDQIFFMEYKKYFGSPICPNGELRFDYYGSNYFTKEQTKNIISQINNDKPVESETLVAWLKKAANNYNGFYICGI